MAYIKLEPVFAGCLTPVLALAFCAFLALAPAEQAQEQAKEQAPEQAAMIILDGFELAWGASEGEAHFFRDNIRHGETPEAYVALTQTPLCQAARSLGAFS